jgi:integrase
MEHLTREEILRLLEQAKAHRERDYVMCLVAFWHGLRASEVVGKHERQHGLFDKRSKAKKRAEQVQGAELLAVKRKNKRGYLETRYQVRTKHKILSGGLKPKDFRDGYLRIDRLKGSEATVHPLMEDANPLLDEKSVVAEYLAKHQAIHQGNGDAQRLFPISRIRFYQLMQRYGQLAGLPHHLCHPHILKHSIAQQSIRQAGIENLQKYLGHANISSTGAYIKVDDQAASRAVAAAICRRRS